MAHTDRDDERWARRQHHRSDCPNGWRHHVKGDLSVHACYFCDHEPATKYWCSTDNKGPWNRDQRQAERGKARQKLRECRDWDDLVIHYYRPYWD